ncbi:MAG: cytochrome c oxidase subunit 3 [Oleispira antarctica]|uniref:cytochrome-c oxidase n=1 Tax=Oleispira antarctica RB-8 TaxID=698738 RepID=R4YSL6_OLEAN|nr:cytochrome c oxidase subunit 3 [Oleispira antarctica]MBQ0791704.1 cytochrome c oxidase subunit 3 [Oleispira antarctica]CCK75134.1 Cytochrome c oxidase, subunit III [Oleispira antarctica RB-8]|tara:strand:- start:5194 stop:6096 length:903 start_codon:yes stop_codon:yes gene_type:complete
MSVDNYYVPAQSKWPIIGAVAVFLMVLSTALMITGNDASAVLFIFSSCLMAYMLFGWFQTVVQESQQGLYSDQLNRSFRIGMLWFIFSEFMFFAAFFGALFYVRTLAIPWLDGDGAKGSSALLWPEFSATWPLLNTPDPEKYPAPSGVIDAWKLPFMNTVILIISSIFITVSHHKLKANQMTAAKFWLALTLVFGISFLCVQVYEYIHAYNELGLTLNAGIYGSTFFMLTGFHGAHVTIGSIMILVILIRMLKGHFDKTDATSHINNPDSDHLFAFEAAAWYWHFVDVIWLFLFLFVYVL